MTKEEKVEGQKPESSYNKKQYGGVAVNHARHPKEGVPWCKLCKKEGRV